MIINSQDKEVVLKKNTGISTGISLHLEALLSGDSKQATNFQLEI